MYCVKEAFFSSIVMYTTMLRKFTCNRTRLLHWDSEDKQLVCVHVCPHVCVLRRGLLYSCIDWEPVLLPQASPTKDARKSHTDVLPPLRMCDSPIANFEATIRTPVQHLWFFRQTDRQTVILYLCTDYVRIITQTGIRG